MIRHYIEFLYPGSMFAETGVVEATSRDCPVDVPKGAYGYRFFSQTEVIADGEVLLGKRKDVSPTTYIGEIYTLDRVKDEGGRNSSLISNMECNGWKAVVKTRMGNFQPLNDGDKVVPG